MVSCLRADQPTRKRTLRLIRRPLVYLFCGVVLMGVGMYYFAFPESQWNLSPAYSRELNANYEFLDFYDKHDIWHFCSAIGLYCLLMILLGMRDTGILENVGIRF
ncbi:SID1 transmembrane family member 2-like [Folsomia candida]|uniref:SID1 transmembrane family member 2-like n=1 Tax=Folsomia candida TaxID=158441 RepID=UPI0016052AB2|nr:SID1 transmembrane family member 2-like [Folsomia candida]